MWLRWQELGRKWPAVPGAGSRGALCAVGFFPDTRRGPRKSEVHPLKFCEEYSSSCVCTDKVGKVAGRRGRRRLSWG